MEKVILISIDGCRADALAPSPHFTVGAFCREKYFHSMQNLAPLRRYTVGKAVRTLHTRDKADLEQAVALYGGSVQRLAFAYLKNRCDAEDVAQEVFLAYLRSGAVFPHEEQRRAWLMTVTANRCRSLLRSPRRCTEPLTEDICYLPPEESAVLRAVLALEEKYRVPIHLHYYEAFSIAEIAALLRRPAATVGSQLARGREKLKKMLQEEES